MLVLTRKKGEAIQIGDSITVKISEVNGNRVKICIDAPQEIRIVRGEIAEQCQQSVLKLPTLTEVQTRRTASGRPASTAAH